LRIRAVKSVTESVFGRPRARPRRGELPGISSEPIGRYRGVIGRKTGFADAAGRILLFEAVRGGRNRQAP
jgi:D-alanyl-D-alanine carboxypeptidase